MLRGLIRRVVEMSSLPMMPNPAPCFLACSLPAIAYRSRIVSCREGREIKGYRSEKLCRVQIGGFASLRYEQGVYYSRTAYCQMWLRWAIASLTLRRLLSRSSRVSDAMPVLLREGLGGGGGGGRGFGFPRDMLATLTTLEKLGSICNREHKSRDYSLEAEAQQSVEFCKSRS